MVIAQIVKILKLNYLVCLIKGEMEEINLITNNGKVIAHHYMTESKDWLIVFSEGLSKEEKDEYRDKLSQKARDLNLMVEFKDEN